MRIFGWTIKKEKRASSISGSIDSIFGNIGLSSSGVYVTSDSALGYSPVYACVRILAESIASLPLLLYRKLPGGGKERAQDHPLYFLLKDEPNQYQDSFQFREMLCGHLLLRGNAYARIVAKGEVEALIPLNPDRMKVSQNENGTILYTYRNQRGLEEKYTQREIFHLRGLSSDGLTGLSPIELLRDSIGLGLAAESYGSTFFSNNARPGGILKHPGKIDDVAAKRLKEDWQKAYSGTSNAHKTAILEEGMAWEQIGLTNADSQFLESRKFQVTDIARIFRVPPHMIGDLDKATFSNIEQQSLEFVMHSLRPWLVRWESAIKRLLLTTEEKKTYFSEFLVDGLLRGDIKSRYDAYSVARNGGWLSVDEIREFENLNPLPDDQGKIYLEPLNMKEVGQEDPKDVTEPQNSISTTDRNFRANFEVVCNEMLGRIVRKEAKFYEKSPSKEQITSFNGKLVDEISTNVKPLIDAYWAHFEVKEGDFYKEKSEILIEFQDNWLKSERKEPENQITFLTSLLLTTIEDRRGRYASEGKRI
jgi:HK97 family phage portal protein